MITEYIDPFLVTCSLAILGGFFGAIGARFGWHLAGKIVSR